MKNETKMFSRDWNDRLKWTQDGKFIPPTPGNCKQLADMCAAQTLYDRSHEDERILFDLLDYVDSNHGLSTRLDRILEMYEIEDPLALNLLWLEVWVQLTPHVLDDLTQYSINLGEADGEIILLYPFDHDDRDEFIETLEKIL